MQEVLASSYPSIELGQHLNGDEAMTFGAAFHAANKTNLFRVRPVYIYEAYEQGFVGKFEQLDADSKSYQADVTIFDKEHHLDFVKVIEVEHDDNLRLRVDFEKEQGEKENLVNYSFLNVKEICQNLTGS